tara:strand:- start:12098 stop:13195 length:1098 start_codon:yes stop_codon:yes gene_type:complete
MYNKNLVDFSEINFKSGVPKYKQLINHSIKKIRNNELKPNSKLPSINELSFEYNLSRDTVERSYKYLKSLGLIYSVKGLGYFIVNKNNLKKISYSKKNNFNKEKTLKKLFNSIAQKKIKSVLEIYHKDLILIDPNQGVRKGVNVKIERIKKFCDLFKDINFKKPDTLPLNTQIKTKIYYSDYTLKNVWTTLSAIGKYTGKKINIQMHFYFLWKKNRIIKEIQFFDPQLIDTELDNKEITLSKICKRNLKPIACESDSLDKVVSEINTSNIGALVVVKNNIPVGVITDGDIRRNIISNIDYLKTKASDIMTKNPILTNKNTSRNKGLQLMIKKSINHLILVDDNNKYFGIVNFLNLVKQKSVKINY